MTFRKTEAGVAWRRVASERAKSVSVSWAELAIVLWGRDPRNVEPIAENFW